MDKYVGRQINVANFKQSILSFLDNGTHYLIGHIPEILMRLRDLYETVSTMSTSRFYASSLLILYDGQRNPLKPPRIKMIDFANCINSFDIVCNYLPTTTGPDGGYLLGLRTLVSNFEEIYGDLTAKSEGLIFNEDGHVLISSLPKSQRAVAEIGIV